MSHSNVVKHLKEIGADADVLDKLLDKYIQFANREVYPMRVQMNGNAAVIGYPVPRFLYALIWGVVDPLQAKLFEFLYNEMVSYLNIGNSVRIVAGRNSTPSGDDALYAAFPCHFHEDCYIVFMKSARYNDEMLFFVQGPIDDFLNVERIGRMPRSDDDAEMETMDRVITVVDETCTLEGFDAVFFKTKADNTVRFAS